MQQLATLTVAQTPSLPPRVVGWARVISMAIHGTETRHHFPKGLTITAEDRELVKASLSTYERILDPTAKHNGVHAREAKLAVLTMLMMGTTSPNATQSGIDARLDMFEHALADVPAWAVEAGVSRWVRRDVPESIEKNPNYNFTPSPQTIRELSVSWLAVPQLLAAECRKILAAIPFEEAMDPKPRRIGVAGIPTLQRM